MGVTFTPVFNRLGKKNKSGLYSVHLRVIIDRKPNYINPKLPKIKKEYWQGKQNKWVKESYPGSFEINSLLQKKISELDHFILKLKVWNKPVTYEAIREFYFKKGDGNMFNDYVEDYIKKIRGLGVNTIKVYNTFSKHLNAFNSNILFSQLNEQLLFDFKDYLQNERNLNGGSTKKYFDKFKVICQDAVKKNYLEMSHNPFLFSDVKISIEKPDRTYLELSEVKLLRSMAFEKKHMKLDRTRDYFLFQIYSGMYFSDLKKLKKENLMENEFGYYIVDKRSKNSNKLIVPLYKFPNANRIIEKYSKTKSEFIFSDMVSDQKYNEALKELATSAGISKNLTNKVGRHTNAQLWMGQGVERQFVSKMLGHTNESTTQHYYDLSIHNIDSKIKDVNFEKAEI